MNILEIHRDMQTLANGYFIEGRTGAAYIKNVFKEPLFEIIASEENGSIHAIRTLKEKIHRASHASKRRIVVLDASLMTWDSKAALLKIIEDPPPHTHIILHAPSEHVLTATLRSRVIIVRLPQLSETPRQKDAHAFLCAPLRERKKILEHIETIGNAKDFLSSLENITMGNDGLPLHTNTLRMLHYARRALTHPTPSLSLFKDYIILYSI